MNLIELIVRDILFKNFNISGIQPDTMIVYDYNLSENEVALFKTDIKRRLLVVINNFDNFTFDELIKYVSDRCKLVPMAELVDA